MSLIAPTEEHVGTQTRVHKWIGVSETDTFTPVKSPAAAEKTVQFFGSFGGGAIALLGSIDGTNYETMKDIENNDINPTANGIFTLRDNVVFVKPGVPAGTSVSVNISLLHKAVS